MQMKKDISRLAESFRAIDNNLYVRIFRACQVVIHPHEWHIRFLNDPYWRLYRNTQDGAWVTVDGQLLPLRAGRLYIIPSHLPITSACDRPVEHFYAHFDVAGIPDIAMRELFQAPFDQPSEPWHEQAIRESQTGLDPEWPATAPLSVTSQCWVKAMIYASLARYVRALPADQVEHCWRLAARLQPVLPAIEYVDAHLTDDLSNPVLARACNMSEGHFIRTFSACVQQTPAQYVQERRIEAATQRLLLHRRPSNGSPTSAGSAVATTSRASLPGGRARRRPPSGAHGRYDANCRSSRFSDHPDLIGA